MDRTGTSLPVPLVFGALGAVEMVRLHFRSEKGGRKLGSRSRWGVYGTTLGLQQGRGTLGRCCGKRAGEGQGQPEPRGKKRKGQTCVAFLFTLCQTLYIR